jgi:hypothetical protein
MRLRPKADAGEAPTVIPPDLREPTLANPMNSPPMTEFLLVSDAVDYEPLWAHGRLA